MLDKVEQFLPQWAIAAICIGVAVAVVMYNGTEYTVCDSQKETLIQAEKKFLTSPNYRVFYERCLNSNRPGGCAPYFQGMKKLMSHLGGHIEPQCVDSVIVQSTKIKMALYNFLLHVTRMAWGDEGPSSVYSREAWLDAQHLKIFCSVKTSFQSYFGMSVYNSVEKGIIDKLPEGSNKERFIKKKEKTLLGVPCNKYL